jgi:TolB protein
VIAGAIVWGGLAGGEAKRPIVEITPGSARAFRVAVQRFHDSALPADPKRADDLRGRIEEALGFSVVLLPLDRKAFLGSEDTAQLARGPRYDCQDWTQSGADALLEGLITGEPGLLALEFRLWDTARCASILRRSMRRSPTAIGRSAKAVADEVVAAFTGIPGASNTEITFVSTRTGQREVFVMDADGKNARAATRNAAIKMFPSWLPHGRAIVYTSYEADGRAGLFLTSRGAEQPGQILQGVLGSSVKYRGVFSPGGKTLAFVGSVGGSTEIYAVGRNGSDLRRLTRNTVIDFSPSWSPDGTKIAFASDRSGAPQVYVMDRDGGNLRRLTFQGSYNTSPAWSPDGRWIAYETRVEGQFDIWLVDPTGEVDVPLIVHGSSDESPSWSPDGRRLIFSSRRRGLADLYVRDMTGLGDDKPQRLTYGAGDNTSPSWGPFQR